MNERARKAQDCLKAAKLLYSRFLVNAYEGNVSVRLGDTILVTPSAAVSYTHLTLPTILLV